MSATAALKVIDALVDGFTSATANLASIDVLVHDGYTVSDGGFLYALNVGVDDPSSESPAPSSTGEQDWAHANTRRRDETGEARSALTLDSRDGDLATLRADADAILAAIHTWLDANPNLGVPELGVWAAGIGSFEVYQQKDSEGGYLTVVFTVTYKARL